MVRLSMLPLVGVSWVALKLGQTATMALMLLFCMGIFGHFRGGKIFHIYRPISWKNFTSINTVIHIHIKVNSMSIWFYRKDDDGKKSIYTVSFPFEVLLVIIGVMAALLLKCCL